MALAGTGCPTYAAKFRELIHLKSDGQYSINFDYVSYNTHGLNRPFKRIFSDTFGPPRLPNEPIADRHRDLAYALQSTVEATILHMVRALSKSVPSRDLCLTGGVAFNPREEAVQAQIRDRLFNMKDGRMSWLEKNIDDTLIGAVLTAPTYVSGFTDAEYELVKLQLERHAPPEIIEARSFSQKALAEIERGWRAVIARVGERAGLTKGPDGTWRDASMAPPGL